MADYLPIRSAARPVDDDAALLAAIGDARFVLLGEASHGTHEFYASRARITQKLIEQRKFTAVVVEADWPDAWRVNRYVRGFDDDASADQALGGFKRFPQWMWRNDDVLAFVQWLRAYNTSLPKGQPKVGFYGMDLYSLNGSIGAVLTYLDKVDPTAAQQARDRYGCFEDFGADPQAYGREVGFGLGPSCEGAVVQQLIDLRQRAADYAHRDGRVAEDEYFYAEQNARLITNAERYYRAMFDAHVDTWNLRDTHMADTLDALVRYLDQHVGQTRAAVWAHNSHLGDARATDVSRHGQINLGQLARERWGRSAFLLGYSTHTGTVTAADNWDAPARRKRVKPSLAGSYERLFHDSGAGDFLLLTNQNADVRELLDKPRLQRAIGVIYRPQTERLSHYYEATLPQQFDAIIHIDTTSAVHPLEKVAPWTEPEVDETFPSGL